jgi:hypothetical protein
MISCIGLEVVSGCGVGISAAKACDNPGRTSG